MNIVCAGDCGVDVYSDLGITKPGGISLNVAYHCKKLFPKQDSVSVLGVIGNDTNSTVVLKLLKANEIGNHLEHVKGRSPIQYIQNTATGEKIFTKYDAGVIESYLVSKKQATVLKNADVIITPLFSQIQPFFSSVLSVPTKAVKIADFGSLEDFSKNTEIVEEYIHDFDIAAFGLHEEDKQLLSDLKEMSESYNKLFIITLGAAGSTVFFNKKNYHSYSKNVDTVTDTTGAGDAFLSAFLSEYLYTHKIEKSLSKAHQYASNVVQIVGSF